MKRKLQIVLFIVLIVSFVIAFASLSKQLEYTTLQGAVVQLDKKDDCLLFWIANNEQAYVVYYDDIPKDTQIPLQLGDTIVFEIENADFASNRVIAHSLTIDGQKIYSTIEQNNQSAEMVKGGFAFCVALLTITLLVIMMWEKQPPEQSAESFYIANPIWAEEMGWFVVSMGVSPIIYILLMFALGKIAADTLIALAVFVLFALLGAFLVYVCRWEYFALRDGAYSYRKPFKRAKRMPIETIAIAQVEVFKLRPMCVSFFDDQNNLLYKFMDDGTAFKNGYFVQSLCVNGITLQIKVGDEIKTVDFDEEDFQDTQIQ